MSTSEDVLRALSGVVDPELGRELVSKEDYLLLIEHINMLEAENSKLRLTVQFYQDLYLDDCA